MPEQTNTFPLRRSRARKLVLAAAILASQAIWTGTARGESADEASQPAATQPARIENSIISKGLDANANRVTMTVGQTRLITTMIPIADVIGPEQEVVWAKGISETELSLTARKPGAVQIEILDVRHHSQTIDVVVEADLAGIRAELEKSLPHAHIDVSVAGGSIALHGHVPSAEMSDKAAQIAATFGGKVLNLLEINGGQQVTLQVRFAEVSRDAVTELGVNFGVAGSGGFGASVIGGVGPLSITSSGPGAPNLLGVGSPASNVTAFGQLTLGHTPFDVFLAALQENNLLRTLAEPNLTVMSGSQASFLAGGEFPYPVPQSGGAGGGSTTITIDYKQYGVRLSFMPVVLGNGRIRLHVQPEVSALDYTHSITLEGFTVPGLTTRTMDSTVELAEGQTLSLAGLLNDNVNAVSNITPLLGDLPVLGALFRSVRYERTETELVVLVTPILSSGMNPASLPAMPGEHWRFPNEGQVMINGDLGGPATDREHAPPTAPPHQFQGAYGFVPVSTSGK